MTDADLWTVADAAHFLDPQMPELEVRAMIALFGIPTRGVLRAGHSAGRPPSAYAVADLLHAHAIVIDARQKFKP